MRRMVSTTLLPMAMLLAVSGACAAQSRGADTAAAAPVQQADLPSVTAAGEPRSAFGKVMAVMISALQRQSTHPAQATPRVRTSETGTPLGISVGAAFAPAATHRAKPLAPPAIPRVEPPPAIATELARAGLAGND